MTARVQLRLRGTLDHLRLVWQAGETLLEPIPFRDDPEGTRYNVLLALQEMVTNVLRHGYQGDEDQPVEIEFLATRGGITITLRDRGPAFDPLQVALPQERKPGQPLTVHEGGYGIMIAKTVMDGIDYRRDGDWNVLTMQKSVRTAAHTVLGR